MLEDRQHNALAALDVFNHVLRSDDVDVSKWMRAYEEAKRRNANPLSKPEPARSDAAGTEVIQIAGKSYTIKQTGPKEWRYEAGINSMNGASLSSDMAREQLIRAMQQRFG